MKILVFGAGVIGTTYAWQLHEAGFDVSLFVRKQKMVRFSNSGVPISYTDLRRGNKSYGQTVFRPRKNIDRLDPSQSFDLIIVAVKNQQLGDVIPYVSKNSGNAHILFLGNLWDEFGLIKRHLPKGRWLMGFPDLVAGSHTDNGINCFIFKNRHTILGEPDGKKSERLGAITEILEQSGLRPKTVPYVKNWIRSRFLISAITPGLLVKAGSARKFANNSSLIKQYITALKEGQKVLRKKRAQPASVFPFNRMLLPAPILSWLIRRSLTDETLAAMDAQMKGDRTHHKSLYLDVLNGGKRMKIPMPYWASFEKYLNNA